MTDPLEEPIRTPLRLDSVTIRPAPQATSVIEGLDLEVAAGESVCLAGRSGTGKTSLLRVAAGLLPPAKGRVLWAGRDVAQMTETERRRWHGAHMGYLDQESAMLEELTIGENVLLPRGGGARTTRQAADRLAELFAALDIAPAARAPPTAGLGGAAATCGACTCSPHQPGPGDSRRTHREP